ncbi:arylsulfatase A-like enzyme [Desulfobaculum xiamenense]|uniref:Arylsulfatase A-like enzyme n=1 Tax=Desulfobaculum xiamenense TaxID=995050 RepID=A0A846QKG2_9BACT|nr:sulfatase [Desulfobaculum xiamenense]NJB68688.1 arylsulfatase A-like enzyme [Desulfobaculum xiamenense]
MKRRRFLKLCGAAAAASMFAPGCSFMSVEGDAPPVRHLADALVAEGADAAAKAQTVTLGALTMPAVRTELGRVWGMDDVRIAPTTRFEVHFGLGKDAQDRDVRVTLNGPGGSVTRTVRLAPGTFSPVTMDVGGAGRGGRFTLAVEGLGGGDVFIGNPVFVTPGRRRGAPCVFLITVDTLRADHLSAYGYHRQTSPVFDAHAREGVLFERAYSAAPWTRPSYASLFTGLPPSVHRTVPRKPGVPGLVSGEEALGAQFVSLAERFRAAGYMTVGIHSVGNLAPAFGFAAGFDRYEYVAEMETRAEGGRVHRVGLAGESAEALIRAVRAYRDVPLFVFVNILDPHTPYNPPASVRKAFLDPTDPAYDTLEGFSIGAGCYECTFDMRPENIVALYDAEIAFTDWQLGRIIGELRRAGLYDDSLVVVTSDHGEELGDHGGWGHGFKLYDEHVRVPLWMRMPGRLPDARVVPDAVGQMALAPTILELAGIPHRPEFFWEPGLVPLIRGEAEAAPVYVEEINHGKAIEPLDAIIHGGRKLVRGWGSGRVECYDLQGDPRERHDIAASSGEAGRTLFAGLSGARGRIEAFRERFASAATATPAMERDPALLQRLKDLGYL